jgi:hypothetical protein
LDGNIVISNIDSLEMEKSINAGCLPRALDLQNDNLVAGLKDGTIVIFPQSDESKRNEVMHGHHSGEVWGLG